jgi:hypothetical protein
MMYVDGVTPSTCTTKMQRIVVGLHKVELRLHHQWDRH